MHARFPVDFIHLFIIILFFKTFYVCFVYISRPCFTTRPFFLVCVRALVRAAQCRHVWEHTVCACTDVWKEYMRGWTGSMAWSRAANKAS